MDDYISREEAKRFFNLNFGGVSHAIIASRLLDEIPAADVSPVRHGRWKYYRKQGIAVCAQCSFERKLDNDFGRAVSCPNCGAKMDGGITHEI